MTIQGTNDPTRAAMTCCSRVDDDMSIIKVDLITDGMYSNTSYVVILHRGRPVTGKEETKIS